VCVCSDDNGLLGPAELYGALRWLQMPDLTPEDVVDFLEAGDVNHDGHLDYKEYCKCFCAVVGGFSVCLYTVWCVPVCSGLVE
jgi:hypothetical protein